MSIEKQKNQISIEVMSHIFGKKEVDKVLADCPFDKEIEKVWYLVGALKSTVEHYKHQINMLEQS